MHSPVAAIGLFFCRARRGYSQKCAINKFWTKNSAGPKSALEGALDVGFGGASGEKHFFVCCPTKPTLEGALDVGFGGATGKLFFCVLPPQMRARGCPRRWIWKGDRRNIFFLCVAPPKSALEGALDVGFGGATGEKNVFLCIAPPNARSRAPSTLDLEARPENFFFFVCYPPQIHARGRPRRWI